MIRKILVESKVWSELPAFCGEHVLQGVAALPLGIGSLGRDCAFLPGPTLTACCFVIGGFCPSPNFEEISAHIIWIHALVLQEFTL